MAGRDGGKAGIGLPDFGNEFQEIEDGGGRGGVQSGMAATLKDSGLSATILRLRQQADSLQEFLKAGIGVEGIEAIIEF